MEPLKNLFSSDLVGWIAFHLKHHVEGFDEAAFHAAVLQALPALELKERSQLIADHLVRALPIDRAARHAILLAMLHPDEFDHADKVSDRLGLCGWAVLPLTLVVGEHGTGDFTGSLETLRQMTKRFSSEFAIRYFLIEDQAAALEIMSRWIFDPNRHVRRLVSEGTRPRLPWAMRLPSLMNDPSPVLPFLKALRDDPEPYVRRSVANHLNDISKDHPGLLAEIAESWMVDASPERRSLLRHASRSLIKSGDARILTAFGRYPARLRCGALELSQAGQSPCRTRFDSPWKSRRPPTIPRNSPWTMWCISERPMVLLHQRCSKARHSRWGLAKSAGSDGPIVSPRSPPENTTTASIGSG